MTQESILFSADEREYQRRSQHLKKVGPAKLLERFKDRNEREMATTEELSGIPNDFGLNVALHLQAYADAVTVLSDVNRYDELDRAIMGLNTFQFLSCNLKLLRYYIYHLIEALGFGCCDEREEIATCLIEMYRRRRGIPRRIDREQLESWWEVV